MRKPPSALMIRFLNRANYCNKQCQELNLTQLRRSVKQEITSIRKKHHSYTTSFQFTTVTFMNAEFESNQYNDTHTIQLDERRDNGSNCHSKDIIEKVRQSISIKPTQSKIDTIGMHVKFSPDIGHHDGQFPEVTANSLKYEKFKGSDQADCGFSKKQENLATGKKINEIWFSNQIDQRPLLQTLSLLERVSKTSTALQIFSNIV